MDQRFREHVDALRPLFERLRAMTPIRVCDRAGANIPDRGVYLLSEGKQHLYVGRSNDIHGRLARHCRPSSSENAASFAFLLAREAAGNPRGTRRDLMDNNRKVRAEFGRAKTRIGSMNLRYVEECDPTRQALLEIYVAVVMKARYNDFDNH